ncbi:MAG: 8-oxo-dGTP diphosphatase [Candidatus Brocadiae bacterium]|nr:8-oxo-dGTP diphosphatase [Candidatus Brocadiia bacterium]
MKLATLCYIQDQGKTLMLNRIKKQGDIHLGKWNGVGGKMEAGETPQECAVREIREETGLIAKKLLYKGFLTFPEFAKQEDWYVFVFVVPEFEGMLIDSPEGVLSWIDDEKILDLPLWEGDRFFLPYLNQNCIFWGKFIYKEKKLIFYNLEVKEMKSL